MVSTDGRGLSPALLDLEELLIAPYYILTPTMILVYLRSLRAFRNHENRFLLLIVISFSAFILLRYAEFLYDLNGPPIVEPFGVFYPLAFWSLPLLIVTAAAFFLSFQS